MERVFFLRATFVTRQFSLLILLANSNMFHASLPTSRYYYTLTKIKNQQNRSPFLQISDASQTLLNATVRKNCRFLAIFTACSLTEVNVSLKKCGVFKCTDTVVLALPPFCGRGPFIVQGRVPQSVFPLFYIDEDSPKRQKTRAILFGHNSQSTESIRYLRSFQDLLVVFSY
jgi:hypothetical protein